MKNIFNIHFNKALISVETIGKNNGHTEYLVHMPEGDMHLRHTEDDEGAGRWIDTQTNHETELSSEVGLLIELHNVQHHGD
jgi:uncharacterized protein involved in high-affinity Fe2+ transport